jgi:hypothetical protein
VVKKCWAQGQGDERMKSKVRRTKGGELLARGSSQRQASRQAL